MCYKSSLTGSEGLLLKIAKVLLGSINKEPDVVLENLFCLQKLTNNSWAQQPIKSAKIRHVLVF